MSTMPPEGRAKAEADIASGRVRLENGWIVAQVDGCTCAGVPGYGHEPGCGSEPITKLIDLLDPPDRDNGAFEKATELARLMDHCSNQARSRTVERLFRVAFHHVHAMGLVAQGSVTVASAVDTIDQADRELVAWAVGQRLTTLPDFGGHS